jgi:hypothetical protein
MGRSSRWLAKMIIDVIIDADAIALINRALLQRAAIHSSTHGGHFLDWEALDEYAQDLRLFANHLRNV